MKRTIEVVLLGIGIFLSLALNLYTVITSERSLAVPTQWKFRISGYDPYDPVRGRYIQFTVDELQLFRDTSLAQGLEEGDAFYAILDCDSEGYAYITKVSRSKPDKHTGWLTLRYVGGRSIDNTFDRYYVTAPMADELQKKFDSFRNSAYITMQIAQGLGVITALEFEEAIEE